MTKEPTLKEAREKWKNIFGKILKRFFVFPLRSINHTLKYESITFTSQSLLYDVPNFYAEYISLAITAFEQIYESLYSYLPWIKNSKKYRYNEERVIRQNLRKTFKFTSCFKYIAAIYEEKN